MKSSMWIKLGIFVLIVVSLGWIAKICGIEVTKLTPDRVAHFVQSFGIWAPVVYLGAYAQPIIPLPASLMTIVGGVAFGKIFGFAAALFGATLRAGSESLVARLLGREIVAKLLKGKVAQLDQKIGENGFKTVLFIRLIPNLPFDVQNYGLGFSKVGFVSYALASFLGMMPGCFAFVYLGYSLTDPKQIWKLGVAIALIVGLIVAQKAWKAKQAQRARA